jgi:hypothetical protein
LKALYSGSIRAGEKFTIAKGGLDYFQHPKRKEIEKKTLE